MDPRVLLLVVALLFEVTQQKLTMNHPVAGMSEHTHGMDGHTVGMAEEIYEGEEIPKMVVHESHLGEHGPTGHIPENSLHGHWPNLEENSDGINGYKITVTGCTPTFIGPGPWVPPPNVFGMGGIGGVPECGTVYENDNPTTMVITGDASGVIDTINKIVGDVTRAGGQVSGVVGMMPEVNRYDIRVDEYLPYQVIPEMSGHFLSGSAPGGYDGYAANSGMMASANALHGAGAEHA